MVFTKTKKEKLVTLDYRTPAGVQVTIKAPSNLTVADVMDSVSVLHEKMRESVPNLILKAFADEK